MNSVLQIRIDDELKAQATVVYDQLGLDLSSAIRMFLKKSVVVNGIPFDTRNDSSKDKAIAAANRMRQVSEDNKNSEMTLEDINKIIAKTRKDKRR